MVHDDRRRGLLWFQQDSTREPHADVLLRVEQGEEFGLVFQMRTRGISEGIARAAIFLVEEVANVRRVFTRDAEFFAHLFVMIFGEGFGGLDAQSMQVEITGVLARFKETLRFDRSFRADSYEGQAEDIHLSGGLRCEEVGDCEFAAFSLAGEGEAQELAVDRFGGQGHRAFHVLTGTTQAVRSRTVPIAPLRVLSWFAGEGARATRFVHDYVVAITLRGEISVDDFRLEYAAGENLFFQLFLDGTVFFLDQARVVFLSCGLQLPFILEQGGVVDVLKKFTKVVVFFYSDDPEGWGWDVGRVGHYRAAFVKHWTGFFIDGYCLRVFLYGLAFGETAFALSATGGEGFHDVQSGKRIFSVEDGVGIFAAQI